MTSANLISFGKDYAKYLDQAILHDDVININTENGNAVVISEQYYRRLCETLYLKSNNGTAQEITEGMREPWDTGEVYDPEEVWTKYIVKDS